MPNVLNPLFDRYVNHLSVAIKQGTRKIGSDTILFNIDGLKDNMWQYKSALLAVDLWSEATGLVFRQVEGRGLVNILVHNDGNKAQTLWPNGYNLIEVPTNWGGTGDFTSLWDIGSGGLRTFMHEFGHGLGLAHGGDYNFGGSYEKDRKFDIDTTQYSIMSYFAPDEYKANNASHLRPYGPMIGDIAAIQKMYGKLPVQEGDTLWGAGSSVMHGISDFGVYTNSSFCIHDTCGYDTFDLSNAQAGSVIDLRPGYFSDINGYVGNVSVMTDTIIERVFGTRFDDTIHGNIADNTMYGNAGNDMLYGYAGDDLMLGGAGNDLLDGGQGSDIMRGGAGDDTYYVDSIGDIVDELAEDGSGIDKVYASTTFSLSGSKVRGVVENLTLTGKANINATGNALDNTVTGNDGDNYIDGGLGHDILIGGLGRDKFVFGTGFAADPRTGVVNPALINSSTDTIRDFVHGIDKIALSVSTFTAFAGMKIGGGILGTNFVSANGPVYAKDANDFLLYDRSTGTLWYDPSGNQSESGTTGEWTGKRMVAILEDENHIHPLDLNYWDFMLVA